MFRPAIALVSGLLALGGYADAVTPRLQAQPLPRVDGSTASRGLAPFHDAAAMPSDTEPARPPAMRSLRLDTRVLRLMPATDPSPAPVITALRLHPNGRMLAAAGDDHRVRLVEVDTGRLLRVLDGHRDTVVSAAFSPDGQVLVTAGLDHRVLCWPLSAAQSAWELGPYPGAVAEVEFNHRGDRLAVVGFGMPLQLIDAATGKPVEDMECPCRDMRCIAFSPDDRLLAGAGRNGRVRIWDAVTGESVRTIEAHRQRVRAIAFMTRDEQVVTASEDRTVRGWDPRSGEELFRLSQETGGTGPGKVLSMVALDGGRLATASSDNHIRIWDLSSQRLLSQLKGHQGSVAALDANTQWLVSGSFDTTIRIWPLARVDEALGTLRPVSREGMSEESPGAAEPADEPADQAADPPVNEPATRPTSIEFQGPSSATDERPAGG
jgi:WD40 repeat protein